MDEKQTQFDYDHLYRGFQNRAEGAAQPEPETPQPERQPKYAQAASRPAGGSRQDPELERRLQKELEAQLHALGQSVTDGLRTGFDGKGQQLGDQAAKFGGAVWDMMQYSFGVVADELRKAADEVRSDLAAERAAAPKEKGDHSAYRYTYSVRKGDAKGADPVLRGARRRFGIGLGQLIPGGIFAGSMLLAAVICLVAAGFTADPVSAQEAVLAGTILLVTGAPFDWLSWLGIRNLGVSKRLRAYAAAIDGRTSISVSALAEAVQKPAKKVRKDLRFLIGKGWLTGWLDPEEDRLYLSAEEWRKAFERRQGGRPVQEPSAAEQPTPAAAQQEDTTVDPDTISRFVQVLGAQRQLMTDPVAAEELDKMQLTSRVIGEWVAAHPESAPKARRFVTYYIPTTLKLLHTYNEMQGHSGENAESIRRDIGGILHTLNIAFENLYNSLLSDVAMDVSSEIAALQGMLAQDGLSQQQSMRFPQNGSTPNA